MRKKPYRFDKEYLLMILLLVFSGNPVTRYMSKYAMFAASGLIFLFFYKRIEKSFYLKFSFVGLALLLLFVSQQIVLGFVSWPGGLNYINTFFFGGVIYHLLSERFAYKYFIALYYISLISLGCFLVINIGGLSFPGLELSFNGVSYVIYTFVRQHAARNCGMFFEPGAFAGILTLCMALNVKSLPKLWQKHKFKVLVLVAALITTKSTTGYIVFFIISSYFMLFYVHDKTIAFTLFPIFFCIAIVVYFNTDFMQDKIESQAESSLVLSKNEFSNTRFGSLIFDYHYIKKHPVTGNGFHEKTRYSDHPDILFLLKYGGTLGNGNCLSNFTACLGVPFMICYLMMSFYSIFKIDKTLAPLVIIVFLLLFFSEQWLTFPLFTGIIFFKKNKMLNAPKPYRRLNELPQQSRQNF